MRWPNINDIVNKISEYVPSLNVRIKLYHSQNESDDVSLQGIMVIIKAKWRKMDKIIEDMNKKLRTMENTSVHKSFRHLERPTSARILNLTTSSLSATFKKSAFSNK